MKIRFTEKAARAIQRVKAEHEDPVLVFDQIGCCGFSNVFLWENTPSPIYVKVATNDGINVYFHPTFLKSVKTTEVLVDAVEGIVDDSFSLEATYDARLVATFEYHPSA